MSENDPADLLPNDRVKQAAVDGDVTQLHRGNQYGEAGDTFEVDGVTFELTDVTERTLGDMTDEDAKREGSPSLDAYKERMVSVLAQRALGDAADRAGVTKRRATP